MAALLCLSPSARADYRSEASEIISRLGRGNMPQLSREGVDAVGAAFTTAELFFRQNNLKMSEQYYLLAIQTAKALDSSAAVSPTPGPQIEEAPPLQAPSIEQALPAEESIPSAPAQAGTAAAGAHGEPAGREALEGFLSGKLVGATNVYIVEKGDTLRLIAAKLGVSRQHLARLNNIDPRSPLKIGRRLKYNNCKIVPLLVQDGIVINIPDRTLYFFKKGELVVTVPVALGIARKDKKYDWTTPVGKFKIIAKQKDPVWYVPSSIRSEMQDHGKEAVASIPPGPTNPLGKYALKTSLPGILIHSTTRPGSIYSFASHGCIRVYPEQMEDVFREIKVNTPGEIIYRPVKVAVTENGRVFLEVHQDVYGKSAGLAAEAKRMLDKSNLSNRVDWNKVESVIRLKAGQAEDVTL
ncbi:L,D-transpeptidase family protein [Geobacter sp. SVR]|uniref:L,D-transpeptidase family protein n=1 Tax=Geobacter sp. SVR TaxID=2495594 RepID=UPI001567418F|nr:L,D-transpeptidase family protein [Geobacter sp. SVR]BCS52388.1 hypothetical protein GSVR_06960 [Geobacter sp. SVR]